MKPTLRKSLPICLGGLIFLVGFASVKADTRLTGAIVEAIKDGKLPLSYESDSGGVAIQFDIIVPENAVLLRGVELQTGSSAHVLRFASAGPNKVRTIIYSRSSTELANGTIANLVFAVAGNAVPGGHTVSLSNVIIATASGTRIEPVTIGNGTIVIQKGGPARLGSIVRSGNGVVEFDLTGTQDQEYTVEASRNLVQWEEVGQIRAGNGSVRFQDTTSLQHSYRFYRAVLK